MPDQPKPGTVTVTKAAQDGPIADKVHAAVKARTPAEQAVEDIQIVRSAHDFDSGNAPYWPEVLYVARAAERLADEVDRLNGLLAATAAQPDRQELAGLFRHMLGDWRASYWMVIDTIRAMYGSSSPAPANDEAAQVERMARGMYASFHAQSAEYDREGGSAHDYSPWGTDNTVTSFWHNVARAALAAPRGKQT